jgi:hypothetical protein
VTLIPGVNQAMQVKQLNEVPKRMPRVVDGFQAIIQCTMYDTTCVDLICIMSVLQQTGTGFEYIAKADQGGGAINDPKLGTILVTSLIYQASSVLDAISGKRRHILKTFCTPPPVATANINHLDTVIGDFRNLLRKVVDAADNAASPEEASSVALSETIANQAC